MSDNKNENADENNMFGVEMALFWCVIDKMWP